MRTGAAAGDRGYCHEAVCYDSDEHLLAVAVPFLLAGRVARGAGQIRIIGELSPQLLGRTWDWWARCRSRSAPPEGSVSGSPTRPAGTSPCSAARTVSRYG